MSRTFIVIACGAMLLPRAVGARKGPEPIPTVELPTRVGPSDGARSPGVRFAMAAANTTLLASYSFDTGGSCAAQGWTVVDATAQIGEFWHVDNFVGANVNPGDSLTALAGSKSLWCGARAAALGATCGYAALPGYGERWDQVWQTKSCIPVDGNLDISFLLETDSDSLGYDATWLEYTTDCTPPVTGWMRLDDNWEAWGGKQGPLLAGGSYAVIGSTVNVRLRFQSTIRASDEDGAYDSHAGPVIIDNLVVEGLPLEDFEDESVGTTSSQHWEADIVPGYGASSMALFRGTTLVQQDVCAKNLSCMWAAIFGSQKTYACGGFPLQKAVPDGNPEGQYIHTEIWSPAIPLVGTGSRVNLQFMVYRDLQLDGLVFYTWGVRTHGPNGCVGAWRSRGFVYFGGQKDWFVNTFPMGDLVDFSSPSMEVSLGVYDACRYWCGVFGNGGCHSHAPLLDNVRVYRVDIFGPTWTARDIDMFQDTFPIDGTDTGVGRADMARSIAASASLTILPGDSCVITCVDPITAAIPSNRSGLADDFALGGKQIYIWIHCSDPAKSYAVLTDDPIRYPFKDTQVADGRTWTRVRCDIANATNNLFCIDLNDNMFESGDVVEFFFGATSTAGLTSYCSGSALNYVQSDVDVAALNASEFTILPLNGGTTTDILYVDGMDGRGAQQYWDTAFEQINATPDRYDVRGPTSSVSNRPGTRVTDVATQLNAHYNVILWDAGDLTQGLGDGTGSPEKSDDYAMMNSFLSGLSTPGGLYLCGDDQAQGLNAAAGGSAVTFKSTYLTYALTTGSHRNTYGISPVGTGVNGGVFSGDTFVIQGGCPLINDFDVMTPVGTSVMQMAYGSPATNNGAVISKVTGNAGVMFSGFSFIYIRDDETDGTLDRAKHLSSILTFFGDTHDPPTGTAPIAVNRLEQNYPNPFNPQTTIAFSLKARGQVRVDIYNVAGEHVKTLVNETRGPGSYDDIRWDGTDSRGGPVASGIYLYRLFIPGFSQTRKMVLLK